MTSTSDGLSISYNAALTNLDALSSLTSGNISISHTGITNVDALYNYVEGDLRISSNSALTNVSGLSNLTTGSLWLKSNAKLATCGGAAPIIKSEFGTARIGRDDRVACLGPRFCQPNGMELLPPVVIDGEEQIYGGNANSEAGCIEDYVPQTSSERLSDLIETTEQINLAKGISNAYDSKLTSAFSALDDTNTKNDGAAFNKLYAFINGVEAQRARREANRR